MAEEIENDMKIVYYHMG